MAHRASNLEIFCLIGVLGLIGWPLLILLIFAWPLFLGMAGLGLVWYAIGRAWSGKHSERRKPIIVR